MNVLHCLKYAAMNSRSDGYFMWAQTRAPVHTTCVPKKGIFYRYSVNSILVLLLLVLGTFFLPKKYNLYNSCVVFVLQPCVYLIYLYFPFSSNTSSFSKCMKNLKFYFLDFVLTIISTPENGEWRIPYTYIIWSYLKIYCTNKCRLSKLNTYKLGSIVQIGFIDFTLFYYLLIRLIN